MLDWLGEANNMKYFNVVLLKPTFLLQTFSPIIVVIRTITVRTISDFPTVLRFVITVKKKNFTNKICVC
jgi:hypothetical protein